MTQILDMNLQAKQLIPEHGNQNGTGTDEISRAGWVIVEWDWAMYKGETK